ncbi:uncharacterized protein TNCV_3849411 [Trichonephila clavipes]|uniref:Uncharacterized protein n=1 Tax=Trichonephila clavipes TaxID=2585209 RepID=A0A8X6RES4_TRICX|nr:uncharacterized protein TNCV_3849411 [Trichonephila clavipes]
MRTSTCVQNVVADVLSRNPIGNMDGSQISCAALRALALNSREQLIREQREDPELEENNDNWGRFLHEFSFELRTAVNEATRKTPAELFLGRKIITHFRKLINVTEGAEYVRGNIEKLFEEARQNMRKQHKTWGKYYNRKRREANIKVNDLVLVQTHFITAAEESRRGARFQYDKARETRSTHSKRYSSAEGKPVWSRQTTEVRPCPYYLRSRLKEPEGIAEEQRCTGIDSLPQNSLRRRSLSMEALDGDTVDRSE